MMLMIKKIYWVIYLYEGKIKVWYMWYKYKVLMNFFMIGIKREYVLLYVMIMIFGNLVDWIIVN